MWKNERLISNIGKQRGRFCVSLVYAVGAHVLVPRRMMFPLTSIDA